MNKKIINSAFFNVSLFSLFWAIEIIIAKLAYEAGAEPVAFTVQVSVLTLVFLTIFILPRKYQEIRKIKSKVIWMLVLANAVHYGLGSFFSQLGIAYTSAINAGFLSKFALITTVFFAWVILKEKLTIQKVLAVIAMFFGSFLISTKGQLIIPQLGDLLIICACFSWSLGNVFIRKVMINNKKVSGDIVSFLKPLSGIPVILLIIFLSPMYPESMREIFAVDFFNFDHLHYAVLVALALSTMWIFLNRGLQFGTASYMTMMSMSTSVLVAVIAIIFLGERMELVQVAGALLIISAGFITHYLKISDQ